MTSWLVYLPLGSWYLKSFLGKFSAPAPATAHRADTRDHKKGEEEDKRDHHIVVELHYTIRQDFLRRSHTWIRRPNPSPRLIQRVDSRRHIPRRVDTPLPPG